MGKYKATVIILNWQGLHLLKRCLPTVIQAAISDGGGHEILVVDNGSTDGSAQYVQDHFPGVAVLPLPQNLGFVGGYNAGLDYARQHLVVLLNNSTWVRPDFLTRLLVHFANPEVFAVAPKVMMPNQRIEVEYLQATWDGRGIIGQRQPGYDEPDNGQTAGPCYTFYAPGGCSAFARDRFRSLGWFHPLFRPFHWEEVDVSYRAWKRGWKVLYEPRAVVWHEIGSTFARLVPADESRLIWFRNRLLFTWSNLTDPEMVGQHHAYLPSWTAESPVHAEAYRAALPLMPMAEQKRYNDQVHWKLTDPEVFNLIGACCSGPRPNGSVVKGSGPMVYLLEGGRKRPVSSMGALHSFSDWAHVIPISDEELNRYPIEAGVDFRQDCLIESPNRAVYWVRGGYKHIVPSPERLNELGRSPAEVVPVSWADLETLHDGPPM